MGWYVRGAGWSSLVARRAHNPEVAGSNPAPATTKGPGQGPFCSQHALAAMGGITTKLQRTLVRVRVKVRYLCPALAPAPLSH